MTDLMSTHVFRKPNARKVYPRNMVLLEKEYQDILRYSVDKIDAYVQENLSALREVISGLSLGPAEYDLPRRNRGYGPVMTIISRKQFQCKLVYIRPDLLRYDHLDRRFGSNPKGKRSCVLSQELLKNRKEETQRNIKQFQEDDEAHAVLHLGLLQLTGSIRNGKSVAAAC